MNFHSKSLVVLFVLVLSGCVPPVQNQRFNSAPSFDAPITNARVYFLNGRADYVIPTDLIMSTRLSLNGVEIGGVNTFEILAFDLKPGKYNFTVSAANSGARGVPKMVEIESGTVNTLSVNLIDVASGQMFGLLGGAVSDPRFEIIVTQGLPHRDPKNTGYVKPVICQDPCVPLN